MRYYRHPGSMQDRARGICGRQSISGVSISPPPPNTAHFSHLSGGGWRFNKTIHHSNKGPFNPIIITTYRNSAHITQKVNSKAASVHAMKAYWGSRCIAPLILDLGTISRWVVSFNFPGYFTPTERTWGTHWTGGRMGLRASLDAWGNHASSLVYPYDYKLKKTQNSSYNSLNAILAYFKNCPFKVVPLLKSVSKLTILYSKVIGVHIDVTYIAADFV
jgi:hypothetical protein